jgi:hypothetical protein
MKKYYFPCHRPCHFDGYFVSARYQTPEAKSAAKVYFPQPRDCLGSWKISNSKGGNSGYCAYYFSNSGTYRPEPLSEAKINYSRHECRVSFRIGGQVCRQARKLSLHPPSLTWLFSHKFNKKDIAFNYLQRKIFFNKPL